MFHERSSENQTAEPFLAIINPSITIIKPSSGLITINTPRLAKPLVLPLPIALDPDTGGMVERVAIDA